MYTQKTDWMNDYLADNNYYVSDHLSYSKKMDLPENVKVSLRFFGNVRIGYVFLLAINASRSFWKECITEKIKLHLKTLNSLSSNPIPLLLFSDEAPKEFGIFTSDGRKQVVDDQGLSQFFSSYNSAFLADVGEAKAKNKTYNDSFQAWTIKHLSRYLTVNDVDSFSLLESNIGLLLNVIELKRPQEESYETWLPYTDDTGNYKAGSWMEKNIRNTTFRTIAYNANKNLMISFFDIQNIQSSKLNGLLFRGSIQAINLTNLQCGENLQVFTSNRCRQKNY